MNGHQLDNLQTDRGRIGDTTKVAGNAYQCGQRQASHAMTAEIIAMIAATIAVIAAIHAAFFALRAV
jgi:hypothetical protein